MKLIAKINMLFCKILGHIQIFTGYQDFMLNPIYYCKRCKKRYSKK